MAFAIWLAEAPADGALAASLPTQLPTQAGDHWIAGAQPEGLAPVASHSAVLVAIRVERRGEPVALGGDEAPELTVVRLDSGYPWADEILSPGAARRMEETPGECRLRVPVDRRLGFAVYSGTSGYAELVVEPGDLMADPDTGVAEVLLELPALAKPGRVSIDESGSLKRQVEVPYEIALPATGIVVREMGRSSRVIGQRERQLSAELAPGSYVLSSRSYRRVFCGVGAPFPSPLVDLHRPLEVRPSLAVEIPNKLVEGQTIDLNVNFKRTFAHESTAMEETDDYLQMDWWDFGLTDELDRYYFTAEIQRRDPSEGRLGVPRPLWWTWPSCRVTTPRPLAPMGRDIESMESFAPGDYVITLRGPMMTPATFDVTVPAVEPEGRQVQRPRVLRRTL